MGMLKQNPCRNVVLPKPDAAEREVMTLEQAQAFVDSLDAAPLQWKAFCVIAIYSGLRRGELLGLEWPDIDFDNRIITVCRESQYNPTDGLYTDMPKTASSRRTLKRHRWFSTFAGIPSRSERDTTFPRRSMARFRAALYGRGR